MRDFLVTKGSSERGENMRDFLVTKGNSERGENETPERETRGVRFLRGVRLRRDKR